MPRMDMRVRHYCVNGWSAVAAWHGVRLSEIAGTVGVDPRASYWALYNIVTNAMDGVKM